MVEETNKQKLIDKILEENDAFLILDAIDDGTFDRMDVTSVLIDLAKQGNTTAQRYLERNVIPHARNPSKEDHFTQLIPLLDEKEVKWREPTTTQRALQQGKSIADATTTGARSLGMGLSQLTGDVAAGLPNLGLFNVEAVLNTPQGKAFLDSPAMTFITGRTERTSPDERVSLPRVPYPNIRQKAEEKGLDYYDPLVSAAEIAGSIGLPIAKVGALASKIPGLAKLASSRIGAKAGVPVSEGVATGSLYDAMFTAAQGDEGVVEAAKRGGVLGGATSAGLLGGISGLNKFIQSLGKRTPEQITSLAERLPDDVPVNISELADSPMARRMQVTLEGIPGTQAAGSRDRFSRTINDKTNTLLTRLRGDSSKDSISNDLSDAIYANYNDFVSQSRLNYQQVSDIAERYPDARIPYKGNESTKEAQKILGEMTRNPQVGPDSDKVIDSVSRFLRKQDVAEKMAKGEINSIPLDVPADTLEYLKNIDFDAKGLTINDLNLSRAAINNEISSASARGEKHLANNLDRIRKAIERDIKASEDLIPDESIRGQIQKANKYYRDYVAPYSKKENRAVNQIMQGERDPSLLRNALLKEKSIPIINHLDSDARDKVAYLAISPRRVGDEKADPRTVISQFNDLSKNKKEAILGDHLGQINEIGSLLDIGGETYSRANPRPTGMTGRNVLASGSARTLGGLLGISYFSPELGMALGAGLSGGGNLLNRAMMSEPLRKSYLRQYMVNPEFYPDAAIPLAARIDYLLNNE